MISTLPVINPSDRGPWTTRGGGGRRPEQPTGAIMVRWWRATARTLTPVASQQQRNEPGDDDDETSRVNVAAGQMSRQRERVTRHGSNGRPGCRRYGAQPLMRFNLTPAIYRHRVLYYSDPSIRAVPRQEAANTGTATWHGARVVASSCGFRGRGYVRTLRKYSQYHAAGTAVHLPATTSYSYSYSCTGTGTYVLVTLEKLRWSACIAG
jgi:hypothetical protein